MAVKNAGWINFVKAYSKENNISYKVALKQASESYKSSKTTTISSTESSQ